MNILNYVQSFDRLEEIYEVLDDKPGIILPQEFYDKTLQMCLSTENETRGVLICKKCPNDKLLVESILTLGVGSAYAVFPDENKLRAVNELLRKNPEFVPIDFHSHTKASGNNVSKNFSNEDISSLISGVNRRNNYMHVLFTPTHVCTFGLQKPRFVVADITTRTNNQIMDRCLSIQEKFISLQQVLN